jgi:hypothetical protein
VLAHGRRSRLFCSLKARSPDEADARPDTTDRRGRPASRGSARTPAGGRGRSASPAGSGSRSRSSEPTGLPTCSCGVSTGVVESGAHPVGLADPQHPVGSGSLIAYRIATRFSLDWMVKPRQGIASRTDPSASGRSLISCSERRGALPPTGSKRFGSSGQYRRRELLPEGGRTPGIGESGQSKTTARLPGRAPGPGDLPSAR